MICRNCHTDDARRKGLCDPCYQHRWRTGSDRPETNVLKHNSRVVDDELVAKRLGRYRP